MKLAGKVVKALSEEIVVIPRQTGDLVFKFRPLGDPEDFNELCPAPKPPYILPVGETVSRPDYTDEEFKKASELHNVRFNKYLFIYSILATPDLEFEFVKLDAPGTWDMIDQELKDALLLPLEIQRLYMAAHKANALTEEVYESALKRFLASQRQAENPTS